MIREFKHLFKERRNTKENCDNEFSDSFSIPKARYILHRLIHMFSDFLLLQSGNTIRLEASGVCQLKCPACPTGMGITAKSAVGRGYLTFDNFKEFIEKNPFIKNIELSNWGEMFLNPQLGEIIRFAHGKKIKLSARNGVNLNAVSDKILEQIVKYKLREITVSIDGANDKTYKIYRRGGNFNKVIENIERINHYKKKYGSRFPELTWQFVIFGHNEHELPVARGMAKKLGMAFAPKFNFSQLYPVKDKEFVRRETGSGAASEGEFEMRYKRGYIVPCYDLWFSPQINWDGKLLGCCANYWGDFGDVFESGLKECLESERYEAAKNLFLGKRVSRKDIPCYSCCHRKK